MPIRHEGDAIARVLVGDGSPVELGTPGLSWTSSCRGAFGSPVPSGFNCFVYVLEGQASFGANTRRAARKLPFPGRVALAVVDAQPGTRFMLKAGKPYGETPVHNGPYVD